MDNNEKIYTEKEFKSECDRRVDQVLKTYKRKHECIEHYYYITVEFFNGSYKDFNKECCIINKFDDISYEFGTRDKETNKKILFAIIPIRNIKSINIVKL